MERWIGALSLARFDERTHFPFASVLNLSAVHPDQTAGPDGSIDEDIAMKIALLALLGLMLGALGGGALGIGAGLTWVEIFKTGDFEGYSGMLVFFTFMPLGAAIGGLAGALFFAVMALRDTEIAIEREPMRRRDN
jgi:hypothetical protein